MKIQTQNNSYKQYWQISKALMRADLKILFAHIKGKLIDASIWGALSLYVMTYLMPSCGLLNFGPFQAPTIIIGVIGFEIYTQTFLLTMEIEKRSHLFYLFTLPIPRSIVFLQKTIFYTLNGAIIGLTMIPLTKLILLDQINFANLAWFKLITTIFASSFLFSGFLLIMVSIVKTTRNVDHVFMRVLFPLWFLGGFQFSWGMLHKIHPTLSYVALLSPYTYAHEAARSAMLGPNGFLPFWICTLVLFLGGIFLGIIGYYRLKKYIDLA